MGQPSIHINIDQPQYPPERPPSPSVSDEDEDGVQVSPDQISPDYSVVHAATASQSGSSQHGGDPFVPLPYPQELNSEPDAYPYQVATRSHPRSRQRSDTSRESSIHREPSRRVVQLQGAHHPRHRPRHPSRPRPDSVADDTDSTEAFLQQPDQPDYPYGGMPRDKQYYEQGGYTQSSSSGSYHYPPVPQHSHHMVPYAPPGAPQVMAPYQQPPVIGGYGYPQQQQPPPPPPPQYPPLINTHPAHSHVASPYSQSPYGPPSVIQYQSPQSYFPPQYPQYPPYYMQQQVQQYQGMGPPTIPPYMHYSPPARESPRPAAASPASAPAKPELDEASIMAKFQELLLAERAERDKKEGERQLAIQSAEDRALAMAQAEKDRREEEKKIRAEAIKAAEEEAANFRKMQQERIEEEKRIRQEALRAAEEEAALQRKRDAERRAEEARIREEARKEALEAEKARIAAEAERAAYEQRIRKEAADAALAAAAAEAKAKQEQADREAKIAADAADAAKNTAEKQAKEIAEAAEKAAKEAAEVAEKAAKEAKKEHEAKLKEAEAAAEAAKKEAEAAEAKAAANAPVEKKAPVRFKDALGRNFNFPWDRCCKWDDMEGLIQQAFAHIDKIGPHVMQGHFDLIGPDKEIIMPDYWEDSIAPGMHITMMLWPIPEPEPEPDPEPDLGDEPLPPPLDGDIIDIDALLNGVKKPKANKDKANAAKKRPGGFASWMLGGAPSGRGRPALKGDKKPDLAAVREQHGAVEQGACTVM